MQLLIIEDDPKKSERLRSFVTQEFPSFIVEEARSYQSGLAVSLAREIDVVILDMSMPTFDVSNREHGGEMRPFAGREVLRELQRKKRRTKAIIVTQFESFGDGDDRQTLDELRRELGLNYPDLFNGVIYYQASETSWQDKLRRLIMKVIR